MSNLVSLLVVDDDRVDRAALMRAVAHAGLEAQVEEAATLREGKDRLEARGYDCAVVDYRLPDGLGACREKMKSACEPDVGPSRRSGTAAEYQ